MKEKLSFFHTTILIYMFQSGIAILSMPRLLAQYFGTNGWVAILIVSLIVNVNIVLIAVVYRLGEGRSVFDILDQSIPKFVLAPVYLTLAVLWAILGCLVSKEYVLIFQMFAFPTASPMALKLMMDFLAFMLIRKGIYVIAKASTVFFWLIIWMLLLLVYFFDDFEWARLTPFLFKDGENMTLGILNLFFGFLGYELSMFIFPYADRKTKVIKAVFIGNLMITFVYLATNLVCFGFYSLDQLKTVLFPIIDTMSFIKLPFIQRVENLFYGFFMFTTIFSTIMYMWAAKEACQRVFKKAKPHTIELSIFSVAYLIAFIPEVMSEVRQWLQTLGYFEIGVAFVLPLVLIVVLLAQRMKGDGRVGKIGRVLLTFFALGVITGCGNIRALERLGFIETQGFDLLPDGTMRITSSIPIADPEANVARKVLSAEVKSSKEAKIKFSRQTSLNLVSGQLRNILYGQSLAKLGLWDEFDTFGRDPSISPQVKISIVNGSASSLLEKNFEQHPRTDKYIDRLLTKEANEHAIPRVTLYEFTRDYYDDGIDPVAPILREEADNIVLDGIGLFKDTRYINKIMPDDTLIFGFLRGSFRRGQISCDIGKGQERKELVMFNSLTSKRKVTVSQTESGNHKAVIEVKVKGSLLEYVGDLNLTEKADLRQLENRVSAHLSERANKMIRFMQQNRVDSVGIGMYVRNSMSYSAWKQLDWDREYPEMNVTCKIIFKIKDIGRSK